MGNAVWAMPSGVRISSCTNCAYDLPVTAATSSSIIVNPSLQ